MRFSRKAKIGAAAVIGSLGIGVAGFAYWTTSGTGTGSATTGTNTAVTVTQIGTPAALVPGGSSSPIDFDINNSASTPQYVTSVTVALTVSPGSGSGPPCTAADFTLVQPTAINADQASGATPHSPSGASLALKNLSTNQDNCKSSTIGLTFTAV
jgi:hypothetical protein